MDLCYKYTNKNLYFYMDENNKIYLYDYNNIIVNVFIDKNNTIYCLQKKDFILSEENNVLSFKKTYKKKILDINKIENILNKYKLRKVMEKHLNNMNLIISEKEKEVSVEVKYSFKTKECKYYIDGKERNFSFEDFSLDKTDMYSNLIANILNELISNVKNNKTKYHLFKRSITISDLIDLLQKYGCVETIFKLNLENLISFHCYEDSIEEYYNVSKQDMKIFYKLDAKYQSFRLFTEIDIRNIFYLIQKIDKKYINEIFNIFEILKNSQEKKELIAASFYHIGAIYGFYKDFNINPKYVIKYITENLCASQFLENILNSCIQYHTYLEKLKEYNEFLNIKIDKKLLYSKHLLSDFQKLKVIIEKQKKLVRNDIIKKNQEQNYEKYKIEELNNDNDNLFFDIPKNIQDLTKGANDLNNCLESYINALYNNYCFILYVYKKNNLNKLYGAIEIENNNKINQAKIKNNKKMPINNVKLIKNHLNTLYEEGVV